MYFRVFSRWTWCAPTTILWNCLLHCTEFSFPMFAILTATHSSGCFCLAAKSGLTLGQAPLSMGFCRQAYWSGLSFPKQTPLFHGGFLKLDRKHPPKHPLVSYNVLCLICLCIIPHSMLPHMYMSISNRCSTATIATMALYSSLYV